MQGFLKFLFIGFCIVLFFVSIFNGEKNKAQNKNFKNALQYGKNAQSIETWANQTLPNFIQKRDEIIFFTNEIKEKRDKLASIYYSLNNEQAKNIIYEKMLSLDKQIQKLDNSIKKINSQLEQIFVIHKTTDKTQINYQIENLTKQTDEILSDCLNAKEDLNLIKTL